MKNLRHALGILSLAVLAAGFAGCAVDSSLSRLRPMETQVYWELVDDVPASAPATTTTQPATTGEKINMPLGEDFIKGSSSATTTSQPADTQAATEPVVEEPPTVSQAPQYFMGETPPPAPAGKKYVRRDRIVDPNQSIKYAYRTNYDYLYEHAMQTVADFGYIIDRQDFRQGVIVCYPRPAAQIVEPWRPDQSGAKAGLESAMHSQRRIIRLTIQKAPNPAFYEVGVQVLVDRETNPQETIGGALTFHDIGSAFGRSKLILVSDHVGKSNIPADAAAATQPVTTAPAETPQWYPAGRDPALENKILEKLFGGL